MQRLQQTFLPVATREYTQCRPRQVRGAVIIRFTVGASERRSSYYMQDMNKFSSREKAIFHGRFWKYTQIHGESINRVSENHGVSLICLLALQNDVTAVSVSTLLLRAEVCHAANDKICTKMYDKIWKSSTWKYSKFSTTWLKFAKNHGIHGRMRFHERR